MYHVQKVLWLTIWKWVTEAEAGIDMFFKFRFLMLTNALSRRDRKGLSQNSFPSGDKRPGNMIYLNCNEQEETMLKVKTC